MLIRLADLANPAAWWRRRHARRHCFHHNPSSRESFIRSQLIEMGMSKMFWCTVCDRTWFV